MPSGIPADAAGADDRFKEAVDHTVGEGTGGNDEYQI